VLCYVSTDGVGINTQLLFPLLVHSGLSQPILGQIWTICNQTCPGQLVIPELWACLALVAIAQQTPNINVELAAISSFPCVPNFGNFDFSGHPPAASQTPDNQNIANENKDDDDEFGDFNQGTNHFGELETAQYNNATVTEIVRHQAPNSSCINSIAPQSAKGELECAKKKKNPLENIVDKICKTTHVLFLVREIEEDDFGDFTQADVAPSFIVPVQPVEPSQPVQPAPTQAPGDIYAALRDLNPAPVEEPEIEPEVPVPEPNLMELNSFTAEDIVSEKTIPEPNLMELSSFDGITAETISSEKPTSKIPPLTSLSTLNRLNIDPPAVITPVFTPEPPKEEEVDDDDFGDFEEAGFDDFAIPAPLPPTAPVPPPAPQFTSKIDLLKNLTFNASYDDQKQENNNSNFSMETEEDDEISESIEPIDDAKKSFDLLSGLDFSAPPSAPDQPEQHAIGMQLASVMSLDLPEIEKPSTAETPAESISTIESNSDAMDVTIKPNETIKSETDWNNQTEDSDYSEKKPEQIEAVSQEIETESVDAQNIPSSTSLAPVSWDVISTDDAVNTEPIEETSSEIVPTPVVEPKLYPKPKRTILDDARPIWHQLLNECLAIIRNEAKLKLR